MPLRVPSIPVDNVAIEARDFIRGGSTVTHAIPIFTFLCCSIFRPVSGWRNHLNINLAKRYGGDFVLGDDRSKKRLHPLRVDADRHIAEWSRVERFEQHSKREFVGHADEGVIVFVHGTGEGLRRTHVQSYLQPGDPGRGRACRGLELERIDVIERFGIQLVSRRGRSELANCESKFDSGDAVQRFERGEWLELLLRRDRSRHHRAGKRQVCADPGHDSLKPVC